MYTVEQALEMLEVKRAEVNTVAANYGLTEDQIESAMMLYAEQLTKEGIVDGNGNTVGINSIGITRSLCNGVDIPVFDIPEEDDGMNDQTVEFEQIIDMEILNNLPADRKAEAIVLANKITVVTASIKQAVANGQVVDQKMFDEQARLIKEFNKVAQVNYYKASTDKGTKFGSKVKAIAEKCLDGFHIRAVGLVDDLSVVFDDSTDIGGNMADTYINGIRDLTKVRIKVTADVATTCCDGAADVAKIGVSMGTSLVKDGIKLGGGLIKGVLNAGNNLIKGNK